MCCRDVTKKAYNLNATWSKIKLGILLEVQPRHLLPLGILAKQGPETSLEFKFTKNRYYFRNQHEKLPPGYRSLL